VVDPARLVVLHMVRRDRLTANAVAELRGCCRSHSPSLDRGFVRFYYETRLRAELTRFRRGEESRAARQQEMRCKDIACDARLRARADMRGAGAKPAAAVRTERKRESSALQGHRLRCRLRARADLRGAGAKPAAAVRTERKRESSALQGHRLRCPSKSSRRPARRGR